MYIVRARLAVEPWEPRAVVGPFAGRDNAETALLAMLAQGSALSGTIEIALAVQPSEPQATAAA